MTEASAPRVLIVGAGIIGAAIAFHLARRGARVTVVDSGEPGGLATRNSWSWINASWGNPEPYFRLRVWAMEEWRRLEHELPAVRVSWTGSLSWQLPAARREAFVAQHASWGYELRCVDRTEARRIEPNLVGPPDLAVHAPREGAVEALAVTQHLLSAARELGAAVLAREQVHSVVLRAGRVTGIETEIGRFDADHVVVAAGAGAAMLLATIGIDLAVSDLPAVLAITEPCAKLLNGLVMTPHLEVRQRAEGRFVVAAAADELAAPADLLDTLARLFVRPPTLVIASHVLARRPIPSDGLPLIGQVPGIDGLYVAVTHSGVTLAPAIGRFVAEEIMTGRREALLTPFGLERLTRGETQ